VHDKVWNHYSRQGDFWVDEKVDKGGIFVNIGGDKFVWLIYLKVPTYSVFR
jgi:hypothetical protein